MYDDMYTVHPKQLELTCKLGTATGVISAQGCLLLSAWTPCCLCVLFIQFPAGPAYTVAGLMTEAIIIITMQP